MDDYDARATGLVPGKTIAAIPGSETEEWVKAVDSEGMYPNEITQRSFGR